MLGAAVMLTACSSANGDRIATRMCDAVDLAAVDDLGVGFNATGPSALVAAYQSTGQVLDTWDPTGREHPTFSLWRGEADSRVMAACWFDGTFRTRDNRTYARALVETNGLRSRLVVADKISALNVSRPPRH